MQQTPQQLQFSTLLQKHKGVVCRVINSYCQDESCRDDLFQEVALKAWGSYESFEGRAQFSTWLYRIAQNTAISRLRRLNKLKMILTDNIFFEIADTPYHEDSPSVSLSIIETLTDREKRTLQMRMDGLSFEEISDQMGEPRSRLIVRMHRIKKTLSKSIRQREPK